jgi:ornithine--oxo-acid transaminase
VTQLMSETMSKSTADYIALEDHYGAHNYHPLDIVISSASGVWLTDVEGRRYLDCLAAYSAVNQGHCHPRIVAAMIEQAHKVTITSRAFRNDQMPLFYEALSKLSGMPRILPMNSGTEAVETAIKAARKWGYSVKGIPPNQAEIIVCSNNFHGRTVTVISGSTEQQYRDGFGPYTPGFVVVPFGDVAALKAAITPNTAAFLFEPIQGEAGIIMPPEGFYREAYDVCQAQNVLYIVDEIQTGLGRTGKMFGYQHETDVYPDGIIIGKALSGGVYPVSAFLATDEVMDVFGPGDHGSTFGGNPLACAVARAALQVIADEDLVNRAAELGTYFMDRLLTLESPHITAIRGRGLMIGIDLNKPARPFCEQLKERGLLCKETHKHIMRLAPPLVIARDDIDWAFEQLQAVLQ